MNRKQFLLALAFVAVFSFLGGIVGGAISGGGMIMAAKDLIDYSLFPKEIDSIKSKLIEVDTIRTKHIILENYNEDIIGRISSMYTGNSQLYFYSKEKPYSSNGNFTPTFAIEIIDREPTIKFRDRTLDDKISIGVFKREPIMSFHYRDKLRLRLGTNKTVGKSTDNLTTMKGSICTYDNKGNVTFQMP